MKTKIILLAIFILSSMTSFADSRIAEIEISGEIISTTMDRILNVLPFKPGNPFDKEKLDLGIKYLQAWGIFDVVEAQTKPTPRGIGIYINLHEAKIISEINIVGHYPYISTKIRKRFSLQVGDMLLLPLIEEQKNRIIKFYEREGYFNTKVETKTEPTESKNSVRLTFIIHRGVRLRYDKIEFSGVHAFQPGRMRTFINHMQIYSKKRLKNALNDLIQFYRDHGYLKAKAKVTEQNIDWERSRVDLQIAVTEGPKVEIFFRGNPSYRLPTLKKTISLYKEGNFDSIEIQDSADALAKKLKDDGYKEAQVDFLREKINPDLYRIYFFIHSGPRSFIYSIEFEGNESISDSKLRKQMFTKKHSATQKGILKEYLLEEDQKILTEFYQSKGFLDVWISLPNIQLNEPRWRYDTDYQVKEGVQVTVKNIFFNGRVDTAKKEIAKDLTNKEGEPFNKTLLPNDLEIVKLFYADHGYPYAKIDQETKRTGDEMDISYPIEEGPLVKIGDIFFIGDVLTSVHALRQAVKIRPGEIYSRKKIIEAGLNLRKIGSFTAVDIDTIGLEEEQDIVHLRVKIEERPPFIVDIDGQYSTDTRYSGTVKFTNYNSFGWAKQTRLIFIGGIEKDRAEVSWLDPRFLGSDIQMTVASWMDYEKETTETSLQAAGSFSFFRLYKKFGFLTRYQLARNYIFSGQARDPRALRDSTLSEIALSGSYNTRDSYSDPTSGVFVLGGPQFFNEIGGLNANFVKLKLHATHFITPFSRLTWNNTFRIDRIQDIGANASVPLRELYQLGGDDTLRGFREDALGPLDNLGDPLGGRVRLILNSEFHIRMSKTTQIALFYDVGTLTNSFPEINFDTIRNSAGFGFRYITPVGPIHADYGIILDRRPGENFGRFHFTFGYPL